MTTEPQGGNPDAEEVSYQPGPAPKPAKPRVLQDGRDMFWSIGPLVLVCLVFAGLLGMCSFQPAGPTAGPAPTFDDSSALHADAEALDFPVRLPRLPEGWAANSGGRAGIDQGRTDRETGQRVRAVLSRVGYLAPSGMYISLTQSNADEQPLMASMDPTLVPRETTDVDGTSWVIYRAGEGVEPVWTTRLTSPAGPAQIAISGAGDEAEFRILAAATQRQQPLPATLT
ncbi:MAG: DUF4245 domain-containing protein [Mycobacterium sp.]